MRGERVHVLDRTSWPAGPWDNEPDKVVWVDDATGLDCMLVRNPIGAWCGYVGVPPQHPWHGKGYSQCLTPDAPHDAEWCNHGPDSVIEVHGGLTYADACQENGAICHVPQDGRPDDVWWFGFDTAHAWDITPGTLRHGRTLDDGTYKDQAYVTAQVVHLAQQLAVVA